MICEEKKGVDWDWRTPIGLGLVLFLDFGPMVYGCEPAYLPRALPQAVLKNPFRVWDKHRFQFFYSHTHP